MKTLRICDAVSRKVTRNSKLMATEPLLFLSCLSRLNRLEACLVSGGMLPGVRRQLESSIPS